MFNIFLSLFLLVSFLITWAGIGAVINNQKKILDNQQAIGNVLENIGKLLDLNGKAWQEQLKANNNMNISQESIHNIVNNFLEGFNLFMDTLDQNIKKDISTESTDEVKSEAAPKHKKKSTRKKDISEKKSEEKESEE